MDLCPRWALFLLLSHITFYLPINAQSHRSTRGVAAFRLVGGSLPSEGNVLAISTAGREGRPLCDDSFGMAEANIVCRALGYPGALRFTRRDFFGLQTQRWTPDGWKGLYKLVCPKETDSSTSSDLTRCVLNNNSRFCTSVEVAGVVCQRDSEKKCLSEEFACEGTFQSESSCIAESLICDGARDCLDGSDEKSELCEEGTFRLDSSIATKLPGNSVAGTVHMKYNNTWSTICDDLFDEREAKVICRNLGYEGGMSVSFTRAYFGEGFGIIGADDLQCTGEEKSLVNCPGFLYGDENCFHSEDAGVFCHYGTLSVQLVDGATQSSGRVEVRSSTLPSSASICDTGFDDLDAQVICRMLGYDGTNAIALRDSYFGQPNGEVWNIILDCIGNENTIQDCRIRIADSPCTQRQTASVSCIRSGSVDDLLSLVLPTECGEPLDASEQFLTGFGKVRGGRVSSRFDVPWLASLRFRTKDFFIDKLWMYEGFEELGFGDNDIALIKIEKRHGKGIRFDGRVKPVCLPKLGETYEHLESCYVTGWGLLLSAPGLRRNSSVPRTAEADFVPDNVCEGRYGTRRFSSSNVCFGKADFINPCSGDSGGPLTCKDQQGRHVLYGIVSVGKDCLPDDIFPNIYTRMTKYLRWIQETIFKDLRLSYPSW
ncbi:neurotrypsin-like isoform X2 [Palaemon carinicauda]|uniref:neurotrypsin-like isoform X2 n=1 Tax=Palaemon carinicauda TaxID=392227 RepID=UPI0035B68DC4